MVGKTGYPTHDRRTQYDSSQDFCNDSWLAKICQREVDDASKYNNDSGLDYEEDDGIFGIVHRRIDMFKNASLRSCPVGAAACGCCRIDCSGDELGHCSGRHAGQSQG